MVRPGQLASNFDRARRIGKQFQWHIIYHHFYLKTGVKSLQDFFCIAWHRKPTVQGYIFFLFNQTDSTHTNWEIII